jgi:hypothetical protein
MRQMVNIAKVFNYTAVARLDKGEYVVKGNYGQITIYKSI